MPRSQVATMPFSLLDLTAKHRRIRDLPEFSGVFRHKQNRLYIEALLSGLI
jgi:hypothetical protein